MTTFEGHTHKFTIYASRALDCYLKIGLVGAMHWHLYKHLSIGDICYLDITVSKQADELRVYETLFELANQLILCGGTIDDIIGIMIGQDIHPHGVTSNPDIPMCKSIVDYVAKYLVILKERKNAGKEF